MKIEIADGVCVDADFEKASLGRIIALRDGEMRLGVACSGGADSAFLLLCMAAIFGEMRKNIAVFHFNHRVRKAADADESFVAALCDRLELKFVRGAPDVPPQKYSEESLRNLRVDFFLKAAAENGIEFIAEGHHAGDVAETMLMRLSRGVGADGLSAPRPVSKFRGVEFLRPLLNMRKEFFKDALSRAKIGWREDESNGGTDFLRNKIRNIAMPAVENVCGANFRDAVCRSRALLAEDADFISEIFDEEYAKLNAQKSASDAIFLTDKMAENAALFRRAVLKIISDNSAKMRAPAVDKFVCDVVSSYGKSGNLRTGAGGKILVFDKSRKLLTFEKRGETDFETTLNVGKNALPDGSSISVRKISLTSARRAAIKNGGNDDRFRAYLDLSAVGEVRDGCVKARSRRAGDAYPPLGSRTPKKIKAIAEGKKIPPSKRPTLFAVCNRAGDILWVPSLPPSDKFKIVDAGAALELTFQPAEL